MNKPIIDTKDKYYCLFPSYHLGNGLVVCKRGADNMPENKGIAFIDTNRQVTCRENLPKYIEEYIIYLSLTDDREISYTQDTKVFIERPFAGHTKVYLYITDLYDSGYAGSLPDFRIVDRRIFPNAISIKKNSKFRIPKPKQL